VSALTPRTPSDVSARRSVWRAVAVPTEHGGWGLTLEPVLLGLFVAPSAAGAWLGAAAFLAFVSRTPLKVSLVDAHRGRDLERTSFAHKVLAVEVLALVGMVSAAAVLGDPRFWLPAIAALPLVGVELWFDMRSRSRRLVPELAGAIGVSAVVAAIVLADGASFGLAGALWLVLAARALASIPFVRSQVALLHGRTVVGSVGVISDLAALVVATAAWWVDDSLLAGSITIAGIVVYQRVSARVPVTRAAILGARQTVVGLTLVLVTALGVLGP
jgi:hypothetical protein